MDITKFFGKRDVLDKGHVELCDGMVCDPRLKIVNAAIMSLSNGEDPVSYFEQSCQLMYDRYQYMITSGAAKEQSRALLPQNIYSECMWTCSLQCIMYFLHQRLKSDAQFEIRQYALAVAD